jgi:cytochrome c oxidase assembly factor CtaG
VFLASQVFGSRFSRLQSSNLSSFCSRQIHFKFVTEPRTMQTLFIKAHAVYYALPYYYALVRELPDNQNVSLNSFFFVIFLKMFLLWHLVWGNHDRVQQKGKVYVGFVRVCFLHFLSRPASKSMSLGSARPLASLQTKQGSLLLAAVIHACS